MEILNTIAGFILLLLSGAFAYCSSVMVSEQKNFSRKTTRRK